jgi:hypothetical protein
MTTNPRRTHWLSRAALSAAALVLAACGTGTPHLQRPLLIPAGTPMPPSISAAEAALAQARTTGAANVQDARYPLAKAEAFLLNAKEEYMDGDPTSIVDQFAKVAEDAAKEAVRLARRR